jgi:hypothetical protein
MTRLVITTFWQIIDRSAASRRATMLYCFSQILRGLLAVAFMAALPAPIIAAPPDIPRMNWQPRSDWINVKTDVAPAAMGDGRADDTAALQAALDRHAIGKTVYLPPGTYRITQTLVFRGQAPGSTIIGHGQETRLVWDGAEGGRMFWSDDIAYSRYIGLSWDGRGKAAIGFDHAAQHQFETELQHQDEAFRNFTGYGIRVGNDQKLASAEILFRNCLFENCGTALGFLTFNDYDNTIDRCEFRNCGTGVLAHKSNFYARNSHFENSRDADFDIRDYAGRIYYGQTRFYVTPTETEFRSRGVRPLRLMLAGDFWYNNHPQFDLDQSTRLILLGNSGVSDSGVTSESLDALSAALDDLRKLGELDYSLGKQKP